MSLTENLLPNAPVAVNYESSGHARNAAQFIRDVVAIKKDRVVEFHLLLKCYDLICRCLIVPHRTDHSQSARFQIMLHTYEFRYPLTTRHAPRCPQIQDHD